MEQSKEDNPESLLPRRVFAVSDFEISNGILKFFNVKGLVKKKVDVVREIPIDEIGNVESYWNEISITWNGITNIFFKKNSFESFSELRDKVRALMEENQETLRKNEDARFRSGELAKMVGAVLPVVDTVFDALRALHVKKVDWSVVESLYLGLGKSLTLSSQTLPSVSLDFTMISKAVALQSPRDVANESVALLKLIHEYFNGFNPEDDFSETHPNFHDATALINSYYALNDILFGRIVGEKNPREMVFLERLLKNLADETNFRVNVDELKVCIDKFDVESDAENVVADVREIFKQQLSQLS